MCSLRLSALSVEFLLPLFFDVKMSSLLKFVLTRNNYADLARAGRKAKLEKERRKANNLFILRIHKGDVYDCVCEELHCNN